VLLGVMCRNIEIGGYAYRYLCNTSSRTDLNYLQGVDGPIGRCFTLIGESGERTFAISPGHMNKLRAESIPEEVIAGASALVLTSYLVRCKPGEPMPEATMKAIEYAKKYDVPVVLTLGTKFVIADNPEWWQAFLKEHVSILAMNEEEAEALTGESDPLLASDKALDWVDLVLCTAGPVGLYMAGFTEEESKRKTQHPLLPGAIAEFNQYEFSRGMRHKDCINPLRIFSHIAPYMGGPEKIMNTNGAGDGALAALLHDITANAYHKTNVPNSSKHKIRFTMIVSASPQTVSEYPQYRPDRSRKNLLSGLPPYAARSAGGSRATLRVQQHPYRHAAHRVFFNYGTKRSRGNDGRNAERVPGSDGQSGDRYPRPGPDCRRAGRGYPRGCSPGLEPLLPEARQHADGRLRRQKVPCPFRYT
jgi:inosine kinase